MLGFSRSLGLIAFALLAGAFQLQNTYADGLSKPGTLAPDFQLEDLDGKPYKLSQFKNNVVFLNFWATWCGPCVEEFPTMEELNRKLRTKPFTMIAVSIDEDVATVKAFLKKLKFKPSFLILHDPSKETTLKVYGTVKFPETFLIDPKGIFIRKFEGAYNWGEQSRVEQIEALISLENPEKVSSKAVVGSPKNQSKSKKTK